MAEEPSISDLIEQLKRIRIHEAQVLEQIERASHREARRTRLLVERAERVQQTDRDKTTRAARNNHQIGDRVRITNGVRAGQIETGVVTGLTATRISVTTDDGSRTWRAYKNVAVIPPFIPL